MANPSKDKGTKFETAIARYMTANGVQAERCALHGSGDVGDLRAVASGRVIAVECKDRKRIELGKWFDECESEGRNAGADMAVLVVHRAGCGPAKTGGNFVVMRLDDFCGVIS